MRIIGVFVLTMLCSTAAYAQMEAGGGRACTQMWCQEGFTLNFEGEGGWPAGNYHFDITADGRHITCEGKLPFASCAGPSVRCDDDSVLIGESGCALPSAAHSFYMLQMPKAPTQFTLIISNDSGQSVRFGGRVEAQCSYPNGEGCDPKPCCSATLAMPVHWE